ncbi:MAG TPA: hypothetical protein VLE53_11910 [Gemmatimonadaceae bacterium]|nr:hypothetical protein [Gemmatimonadaceae bacterium]
MLFSDRSLWTMFHGIVLSGAALAALVAALFFVLATRPAGAAPVPLTPRQARWLSGATILAAVTLWLVVIVGTYVVFPLYRVPPPEGATDLALYPRAMLLADPATAWLHSFAMEIKEHVPFIAAILATGVAAVGARNPATLVNDPRIRAMGITLLTICLGLVSAAGLLGTFINKVAPLQ